MHSTKTQLKALALVGILLFGISAFDKTNSNTIPTPYTKNTASVFSPIANFFGFGNTVSVTGTNTRIKPASNTTDLIDIRSTLNTQTRRSKTDSAKNNSLKNKVPTLLCAPNIIVPKEPVIIMWACRDGAQTTQGTAFNTNGNTIGALRVTPTVTTQYGITCSTDSAENIRTTTSASCTIQVDNPSISLVTASQRVVAGESVTLSWKATEVQTCSLRSNTDTAFVRSGIEGKVVSSPIYVDTVFTAYCKTNSDERLERSILVTVK